MFKSTTILWQCSAPKIFKSSLLSSTVAAFFLSSGCSSTPAHPQSIKTSKQVTSKTSHKKNTPATAGYLDASSLDALEDLLSATDMRAVEGDRLLILKHGDVWKRMSVGFKMDTNKWDPRIEAQRSWFISRQPYLDRLSARASRYLYHTVKEAERRGVPTELALLPIIESSYDPAASSSASAAGLWQFIPSTGRIYGLQQVGNYDARRDVVESTRAAYEFLSSLYNQFGSWELALAAYNAGPGRVQQAINRNAAAGLPTDFWSLRLPQETMNYVPRFLAVAQIVKNPKAYGVNLPPIANRTHFREVFVQPGLSLNQISSMTGLTRSELYALNPGYRGEMVDALSPRRILLPADVNPTIDKKLAQMAPDASVGAWTATSAPSTTYTQLKPTQVPKNASGLATFANNADVPSAPRIPVASTNTATKPIAVEPPISTKERDNIQAEIKALEEKETVNNVVNPVANKIEQQQVVKEIKQIAPAGTEVVDPYDGKIKLTAIQTGQSIADQEGKEVKKSFAYPKPVTDNLSKNSDEVQRNKDRTYVKTETDVIAIPPKAQRSTYRVVSGDTLAIIASKNGVNWRDIAKWNQIDPNAPLLAGSSLYLYDAKPQQAEPAQPQVNNKVKPESYDVQSGDTLLGVANQFNIAPKDLAEWNGLSVSSNLFVGQKLALKESKTAPVNMTKREKEKTKVYAVKKGEYLKLIADRYGLSNQELAALTEGLSSDTNLLVGQKINVPLQELKTEKPVEVQPSPIPDVKTEPYKVKSGETLKSIATKSKLSLADLAALNRLKVTYQVRVGESIKVPEGTTTPEFHTVKSGDNLSNIASRYNLQLDDVAKLNGLSKTSGVRLGQRLKLTGELPVSPAVSQTASETNTKKATTRKTEVYVVKAGDSLTNLASKHGLSVKELAELNDLPMKTSLTQGKKIKVPAKQTMTYKVKNGENLIRLATKYGLEPKELAEMNGIEATTQLRIGQVIQIPQK